MLAQVIKYFRFEQTTQDGYTYTVPVNFDSGTGHYDGYDLAPWTISYVINADVDLVPDTFTIIVDKNFFRNPKNTSELNVTKLTDPDNAFQINVNHVIVIAPTITEETSASYFFEDNGIHGAVFGKVKLFKENTDTIEITCESFIKYLNEKILGDTFKILDIDDRVNQTQMYYDYSEDENYAPYFAPANADSADLATGRYRILPAPQKTGMGDTIPFVPREVFKLSDGVTTNYLTRDGYSTSKIIWRLLQECGWCRKQYKNEILEYNGAIVSDTAVLADNVVFLNPYQTYTIPIASYNPNTMIIVQTLTTTYKVQFKSFDTDGFRYDFLSDIQEDYNTTHEQTYLSSFDPSKQSILFNIKTISDSDGMFLYLSYAPRIAESSIVWDYSVYEENGDSSKNLFNWGIYAGFRPKILIRRNPVDTDEEVEEVLKYGQFTTNPLDNGSSRVLTKSIKWNKESKDMINKMLVKYGQNSSQDTEYIELPFDVVTGTAFLLNMVGAAPASITIDISLLLGHSIVPDTFTLSGSYSLGTTAETIAEDLVKKNTSEIIDMSSYNGAVFFYVSTGTSETTQEAVQDFWNNEVAPLDLFTYTITYGSEARDGLAVSKEFATEPEGFTLARDSAIEYGVKAVKLSFPELKSLTDVMKVADKIFKKFAPPKYNCETFSNDTADGVLQLFKKYEVIDESNTKQIVNRDDSYVEFTLKGAVTMVSGSAGIMLPQEDSSSLMYFPVWIRASQTAETVAINIVTAYNALHRTIPTVTRTGTKVKFLYPYDANILSTNTFTDAVISIPDSTLNASKLCVLPSKFKQVTYDEELVLMRYCATSTSVSTSYIFGLPTEDIWNVLNSMHMYIGDVEKGA